MALQSVDALSDDEVQSQALEPQTSVLVPLLL